MEWSWLTIGFVFLVGSSVGYLLAGLMFTAGEAAEVRARTKIKK